jgi:hypothetical protein
MGSTTSSIKSTREYLAFISSVISSKLTPYRPGPLVESHKGKELQSRIWREIIEVLEVKSPGVAKIVGDASKGRAK